MSGVKRRYQGVPVMQLAIEDYPANNLPKVQQIVTFASDLESLEYSS
jgi:hypothetical protein